MPNAELKFAPDFLDRQRRRLVALRQQALAARQDLAKEQAMLNAEASGQAQESEDDAQRLAALELPESLRAVDDARLDAIERALQKLDEGSYGLSDLSQQPIPIDRLEAIPEAVYTVEEQSAR